MKTTYNYRIEVNDGITTTKNTGSIVSYCSGSTSLCQGKMCSICYGSGVCNHDVVCPGGYSVGYASCPICYKGTSSGGWYGNFYCSKCQPNRGRFLEGPLHLELMPGLWCDKKGNVHTQIS